MKFIHTSDWHLGNSFSRFSEEESSKLRDARFRAVENLFEYARGKGIGLIISAGDQFDNGEARDASLIYRLFGIIRNYPEISVIMIAGNHDPFTGTSIYNSIDDADYPGNLKFIRKREVITFEDSKIEIYAASCVEKFSSKNPVDWIGPSREGYTRITMAHGSLKIEGMYNPNDFPIDVDSAKKRHIDYLALGHWHSYYNLDENIYYPGTIEPLQAGDEGCALEVELAAGHSPVVKKITGLNVFSWQSKEIKIDDGNFETVFEELRKGAGKNKILAIKLSGYLSIGNYKRLGHETESLSYDYFRVFADNSTSIKPDIDEITRTLGDGALKKVVHKLSAIKRGERNLAGLMDPADADSAVDGALIMIHDYFRENGR